MVAGDFWPRWIFQSAIISRMSVPSSATFGGVRLVVRLVLTGVSSVRSAGALEAHDRRNENDRKHLFLKHCAFRWSGKTAGGAPGRIRTYGLMLRSCKGPNAVRHDISAGH